MSKVYRIKKSTLRRLQARRSSWANRNIPRLNPEKQSTDKTNYGKLALYGAGAVGIGLVGYGLYSLVSGLNNTGKTIDGCLAEWNTAFNAYTQQYQAYVKANGGQALSVQQSAALQTYVTIMNNAENCAIAAADNSTSAWTDELTKLAIIAAGTVGAVAAFKAYLNYKPKNPGEVGSGSEARAAMRPSVAQTELDNGNITSEQASALNDQSGEMAQAEAADETSSTTDAANAAIANAEAVGDTSIVDMLYEFITDIIDLIEDLAYAAYLFFASLFA